MKKELNKIFISGLYLPSPKKISETNKTLTKSIDDSWSSDLFVMYDYGPKNNRGYRYTLVVIDNFRDFGWTIPLRNIYAQSTTDALSEIIKSPDRKPNLLETDGGKEKVNKTFNAFLNNKKVLKYSRYTDKGVFLQNDLIRLKGIY